MAESALAEDAYYHTLNSRPYLSPVDSRDDRLAMVVSHLPELPAELRWKIFEHAFWSNRVFVTSRSGCYCSSEVRGPYRADHLWLLSTDMPIQVRCEAQRAFVQLAIWEVHCQKALGVFVSRMAALRLLEEIRHVRLNVFETEPQWMPDLTHFPNLLNVTFSPWQKCWTINIPAQADSEMLSDKNVMDHLWAMLTTKSAYAPVIDTFKKPRTYTMHFVFPIRYHLPRKAGSASPFWQLDIWRANLDKGVIDRHWREVHLVQEATLE
ncbi:hypothetical protein PV08_06550 [Exophiala spinifera]|uniref:Uncharacterized protein n=1 Tax=Exophiala spinifera TaxID=91928 RepID=A0A0D2BD14_9EURO|nr:uncharacterized protein PV08_06550 [Exophiala spinifera]KIW16495.1 hypothetical protein PV08_06550 [Exophiala spinifera]